MQTGTPTGEIYSRPIGNLCQDQHFQSNTNNYIWNRRLSFIYWHKTYLFNTTEIYSLTLNSLWTDKEKEQIIKLTKRQQPCKFIPLLPSPNICLHLCSKAPSTIFQKSSLTWLGSSHSRGQGACKSETLISDHQTSSRIPSYSNCLISLCLSPKSKILKAPNAMRDLRT